MRIIISIIIIVISFECFATEKINRDLLSIKQIEYKLDLAVKKAIQMSLSLNDSKKLPRSTTPKGDLVKVDSDDWTSGFFPGQLWYLYEYSRNKEILKLAKDFSNRVENQKYTTDNHDVGFMIYCSFGNGYRITGNNEYKAIMITAAKSLMTRYNPKMGLIRSWDFNSDIWQYPVIIDNMMNLELLFFVARQTNDTVMYNAALSHANKTLTHHFRKDYSCYHVVSYDTISGLPHRKQTFQGLNDSSSWARGQGWALYGYTMVYRETGDVRFLNHAIHVANYIINHHSIPDDKIPLWDFCAPKDAPRDASAGALITSGLIELAGYVPNYKTTYLDFAKKQIISLSSDRYFAANGTNANFILKHSVGFLPKKSEIDVPLNYADYYYVEAIMRYRDLINKNEIN